MTDETSEAGGGSGWSTHHELRFIETLGSHAVTGMTPAELLRKYRLAMVTRDRMGGMNYRKIMAAVDKRLFELRG